MKNNRSIHPDFAKLPRLKLKFTPFIVGLINLTLFIQNKLRKSSQQIIMSKRTLTSSDGKTFSALIFKPKDLPENSPALIYYHGGGFAISYGPGHLHCAERYAHQANCTVIFIAYRLAPKHPFPYGFNDCYSALQWTIEHAETLGIDKQRIAVGGDSAGGALAAGVAQKALDEKLAPLCGQLLIYPALDYRCSTDSARNFVDTPLWNSSSNIRMWEMYLQNFAEGEIPDYASPGHGNIEGLSHCYIETAEFDPLRDEGLNFANRLQAQQIELTLNPTQRTVHGYDINLDSLVTKAGIQARINFLKEIFKH